METFPRERLLERGAITLSDLDLLMVLLETGVCDRLGRRSSVRQLAESLLSRFGHLHGIFGASPQELRREAGIGPAKAARLLAAHEVARRLSASEPWISQAEIGSSESAATLFAELRFEPKEIVAAAFLTSQHRLLRKTTIFVGGVDGSLAHPREILREALRANAARLVVAHNHPSGEIEPSAEDILFTRQLVKAAYLVGVPLLDHLIVGTGGKFYSFRDHRMMENHEPVAASEEADFR